MKIRTILILIVAGMLFFRCSSSEPTTNSNLPAWYTNPPSTDNKYIYAIGEAVSSRRSMARKQALQDGRSGLALKLESEVSAMQKNYAEETTSGDNSNYREVFAEVSKSVDQQTLRRVEVNQSRFTRTDNNTKYKVILLVRLPFVEAANAMNQALQHALSKDEELYTEFRSSNAFKEMKQSIEEMKKGNMPSEQQ